MNIFEQIVADAEEAERTHHQRRGMKLRQWFKDHPDCYYELLPLNWKGEQLRHSENKIRLDFRMGPGWWDRVTDDNWIGLPQHRCERPGTRWDFGEEETVSEMETSSRQLAFDW